MKTSGCPLCKLQSEKEKKYYEDKSFIVLKTKTAKGHKVRIMIVYKLHEHTIPQNLFERALDILSKIGRQVFAYTPKFVIMDTTFATIKRPLASGCNRPGPQKPRLRPDPIDQMDQGHRQRCRR